MIRQLFNLPKYFIDSSKNIKVFFVRISSNECSAKFCFIAFLSLYFIVSISVNMIIFINFLLQVYNHENINQSYCVCLLSPSNELFIFVSKHCSLITMTSYYLNYIFVLNLCAPVALQSMITLITNSFWIIISVRFLFLVHLLVHIFGFYRLYDSLL